MRVLVVAALRVGNTHLGEQLDGALLALLRCGGGVDGQALSNGLPNGFHRVEGVVGVLGDQADPGTADPSPLALRQVGQWFPIQGDAARGDRGVSGE